MDKTKKQVWLARDMDGRLYTYQNEPARAGRMFIPSDIDEDYYELPSGLMPELTPETSPRLCNIEITITPV